MTDSSNNERRQQELANAASTYVEIETSRTRFRLLAEALEHLAAVDARAQILETVLAFARRLVGADGVTIVLREGEECFYAHADSPTGPLWEGQRFPLISCISGWTMLNRRTAVVPDIYIDSRIPHAAYRPTFVRSLVMVPVGGRACVASVGAYWADVRSPTAEEVSVLETLARAAGTALERCSADELLRASEQRFRSAFNSTLVGLIFATPDGRILEANARFSEICGYPSSALVGTSLFDLAHPDDTHELRGLVQKLMSGNSAFHMEMRCQHASGSVVWLRTCVSLMAEAAGHDTQLAASAIDITEEKAIQERLLQAQKLDSVGQLTGGIAHDFNNLLTVINGSMEIIADQIKDKPQLDGLARAVTLACKQGADLTNRLLAFASRQTLEPKLVRPAAVVTAMSGLLRHSLGVNIALEVTDASEDATAVIDPVQLESALLNLCMNARDAMPGGGTLSIATTTVVLPDPASGGEPVEYVMIAVSDTGTGMSADLVGRAFEPFFTTRERGPGTGLGLSMVYGFAKQSRGHVSIESIEGKGTTISLYLPAAQAPGKGSANPAEAQNSRGGGRIILVEDDVAVQRYAARILVNLGYDVHPASSPEDAIAMLARGDVCHLLLTEVELAGQINGLALAAHAGQMRPGMPVLLTSGRTENTIDQLGLTSSNVRLLRKPYRRLELAVEIERLLAGSVDGVRSASISLP